MTNAILCVVIMTITLAMRGEQMELWQQIMTVIGICIMAIMSIFYEFFNADRVKKLEGRIKELERNVREMAKNESKI